MQERLEKEAGIDEASYRKALVVSLRQLLCQGEANAIHILRGVVSNGRLSEPGPFTPPLIDLVMGDKCPVSAALTDDDKAKLRKIERKAEEDYPPVTEQPWVPAPAITPHTALPLARTPK